MWVLARPFGPRSSGVGSSTAHTRCVSTAASSPRVSGGYAGVAATPRLPAFAHGCYAYQINGLRFSYRIVFEAKLLA
jgi:hypothetical protein